MNRIIRRDKVIRAWLRFGVQLVKYLGPPLAVVALILLFRGTAYVPIN